MNKFKKVFLTFTNKKGEVKKVNFYIDRYVYHLLNDKSVSKEFRQKFLVYEYHEYEKERIRKRKEKFFKNEFIKSIDNIADSKKINNEEFKNENLKQALLSLNERERKIVKMIYFEDKKQTEVAEYFKVSKSAISHQLSRIIKKIKKFLDSCQLSWNFFPLYMGGAKYTSSIKKGGMNMKLEIMVTIISFFASLSSIVFACLAFKRSEKQDCKIQGKTEGVIFSDVGYIKACVDRVEKNLNKVDDRYRSISERLAKLEESLLNVTKRVDEIYTP